MCDEREVQSFNMELQEDPENAFGTSIKKDISKLPDLVESLMRDRILSSGQVFLEEIDEHLKEIKLCRRLIMVACGTSYSSAIACRQVLEELSELPVVLELASGFLDRETPIYRDDGWIFISQSGETVDTLMALRHCKSYKPLLIGITNTIGSSIWRESDFRVHINAEPKVRAALAKTYASQIISLLMFALCLSEDRLSAHRRRKDIIHALKELPDQIREVLSLDSQVLEVAKDLYNEKSLLIMGRVFNFATCIECALKKKKLLYIHCGGSMSGELKHESLAMVNGNRRICIVVADDKKSLNALSQVTARGDAPIMIVNGSVPGEDLGQVSHILCVPKTVDCLQNILSLIPLQLLSYHIAKLNGMRLTDYLNSFNFIGNIHVIYQ